MKKIFIVLVTIQIAFVCTLTAEECHKRSFKFKNDCVASNLEQASMTISLIDAVNLAVERNFALKVKKFDPEIKKQAIEESKAKFDSKINAYANISDKSANTITQQKETIDNKTNKSDIGLNVSKSHTSGTLTSFDLGIIRNRTNLIDDRFSTRIGVNLQQPLKRGAGKEINLVSLKKAELDQMISEHELRAFVTELVAQTEKKYWQTYYALEEIEILKISLKLAREQYDNTSKKILAGSVAESELAAASAEVAMRKEHLINAESKAITSTIELMRIMNPETESFWNIRPTLSQDPQDISDIELTIDEHMTNALFLRPELTQAAMLIAKDELEVLYTANGLLPKLDFFVTLGKTGYAESFGRSNPRTSTSENFDVSAGFLYEINRDRKAERAKNKTAELNKAMRENSLLNLKQLIKEDVLKAYIESNRSHKQIEATRVTTELQREKLRIEEVKFNVGKSTSFQVAQAQRDLTAAMLSEAETVIGYIMSLVDLFKADGTLLNKRNILIYPLDDDNEVSEQPTFYYDGVKIVEIEDM